MKKICWAILFFVAFLCGGMILQSDSIIIEIDGVSGIEYYVSILCPEDRNVEMDIPNNIIPIDENDKNIFNSYEDTDGYTFTGWAAKCTGNTIMKLSKSFPVCRTIEARQTGLRLSLADRAAS